ncbi:MAG: nitrilase-related carbon-nitrogen hydrolase [Bacillota bacterium]
MGIIKNTEDFILKKDFLKLRNFMDEISGSFDLLLISDSYLNFEFFLDKSKQHCKDHYHEILDIYSRLAKRASLYLAVGIILEAEEDDFYQSGFIFDSKGEMVLKQRQLFLRKNDNIKGLTDVIRLKSGSEINYANIGTEKVAFMLDRDCWHPEVGRVMALEAVDLVLAINVGSPNPWYQLSGVWSQVQQNQFIALESSKSGEDIIHAPCEMTPYRTGLLAPCVDDGTAVEKKDSVNLKEIIRKFENNSKVQFNINKNLEFNNQSIIFNFERYDDLSGFTILSAEINMNQLEKTKKNYSLINQLNPLLYLNEMGS